MPRRRPIGSIAALSRPSIRTHPAVGVTSRLMTFKVVVLPHPDAPSSASVVPRSTVSDTSRNATCPSAYTLRTPSSSIMRPRTARDSGCAGLLQPPPAVPLAIYTVRVLVRVHVHVVVVRIRPKPGIVPKTVEPLSERSGGSFAVPIGTEGDQTSTKGAAMKKSRTRTRGNQVAIRRPVEIQMPLHLVEVFSTIEERFFEL